MGQSKSTGKEIKIPKRSFSLEFFVGLFTLACFLCIAYLSVNLGGIEFSSSKFYEIEAEFDNISGLKTGASVEIAGVSIGNVSKISFEDPNAIVTLKLHKDTQIRDDDIASIRTKGIIGDKYVKISRGASDMFLAQGDRIFDTESVIDIEDVIGKVVHSLGADKDS